jgi:hypothetical protein
MKILLVNPPVVRCNGEIEISSKDKILSFLVRKSQKLLGKRLNKFFHLSDLHCNEIRYGNRAGSRWPETFVTPGIDWNFPFVMALTTSYLRANGIIANMIDCVAEYEYSYDDFLERVKNYKGLFEENVSMKHHQKIWEISFICLETKRAKAV